MLYESLLLEVSSETKEMDTITEYLVASNGITINEANELIFLIEEEKLTAMKKLAKWYNEKKAAIKKAYQKRIFTAEANVQQAKLSGKKGPVLDRLIVLVRKLKAKLVNALKKLAEKYASMKAAIAEKAGKSKSLVKISNFAKTHPKLAKAGKVGAIAGAGAATYAAYKGMKK